MNYSLGANGLSIEFDEKTPCKLVYQGKVVMSSTEKPYLQLLLSQFENLRPRSVLEVGFGLGIAAGIIQEIVRPAETHDIIEIESSIFLDLLDFSQKYETIHPIYGDFYKHEFKMNYDFLFFDPYDYGLSAEHYRGEEGLIEAYQTEEAVLAFRLLDIGGILCHPFFGDMNMPELLGFQLKNQQPVKVPGFLLWDGSTCDTAQIGYYVKRSLLPGDE